MRLVGAAASGQDAAIFLAAAYTGLDEGSWSPCVGRDVLFEQESIRVRASYSYGAFTTPNLVGREPFPRFPLSPRHWRGSGSKKTMNSFPRTGGRVPRRLGGRRRYKAALKRAGLRDLRFHDLRHCFGSLAINALRSSRSSRRWGMPTCRRQCATSTTRAVRTRRAG
jgi:integrase